MHSDSPRPWLFSTFVLAIGCGDPSGEGTTGNDEVVDDTEDEIGTSESADTNSETSTSTGDGDGDGDGDTGPTDSDSTDTESDDGIKFDR